MRDSDKETVTEAERESGKQRDSAGEGERGKQIVMEIN